VESDTKQSELLVLEEVCAWLRKSPAQLRWMRHNGTGPRSAKVGGRVMFRRSDVEAWIDAQFAADSKASA
jgi:predicted DNA-binding transcriptional regulator AlpA